MKETIILRTLCGCKRFIFIYDRQNRVDIDIFSPPKGAITSNEKFDISETIKKRSFEFKFETEDGYRLFEEVFV